MPAHDVRALLQALGQDGDRREAAIARLTILGSRVVPQLVATFESPADRDRQIAVLRVLEAIADERGLPVARAAVASGGDVALAAVAVLRELLTKPTRGADVQALDLLLDMARDSRSDRRLRAAAREALDNAPEDVRAAVRTLGTPEDPVEALWQDALAGHLPDDARQLREAVSARAADTPLADLRRLIEAIAERERAQTKQPASHDWTAARGAVHQALALRGSRVALYDLRETFERASGPLPSPFLAAVTIVGDDSCVEPLAAAFAHADEDRDGNTSWRRRFTKSSSANGSPSVTRRCGGRWQKHRGAFERPKPYGVCRSSCATKRWRAPGLRRLLNAYLSNRARRGLRVGVGPHASAGVGPRPQQRMLTECLSYPAA